MVFHHGKRISLCYVIDYCVMFAYRACQLRNQIWQFVLYIKIYVINTKSFYFKNDERAQDFSFSLWKYLKKKTPKNKQTKKNTFAMEKTNFPFSCVWILHVRLLIKSFKMLKQNLRFLSTALSEISQCSNRVSYKVKS